jgi:predicted acylesterase/phospholipase RssA
MASSITQPRVLILGPGGTRGFAYLGLLVLLEDSDDLVDVDTYVGGSSSAVLALLLCLGYSSRQLVTETLGMQSLLHDVTSFPYSTTSGNVNNQSLRKQLSDRCVLKLGSIPSLYDLYMKTGKVLCVPTYNLTDRTSELLTPFTHGGLSCIDAVIMSLNMPLLQHSLQYMGKSYGDSLLGDPFHLATFAQYGVPVLLLCLVTRTASTPANRAIVKPVILTKPDTDVIVHSLLYHLLETKCDSALRSIRTDASANTSLTTVIKIDVGSLVPSTDLVLGVARLISIAYSDSNLEVLTDLTSPDSPITPLPHFEETALLTTDEEIEHIDPVLDDDD